MKLTILSCLLLLLSLVKAQDTGVSTGDSDTPKETNYKADASKALEKREVPPECANYNVLDGADRAENNSLQNNVRCDQRELAPGWYRFQGDAGDMIPDKCVPMRRCGTHAPGWITGGHPTVAEGAVTRKVCYHWSSNCCLWSNNIKVRNCGGFYVYELQRTPHCSLRYCGNGGQEPTSPPPTTPPESTLPPPTTTPEVPPECANYNVLDGADRAQNNSLQNNVRCDQRDLAPGWYRFRGAAGDRIPDQCVPMRRCGTHAPGWLDGAHPTVAEGSVTRKVCYHWSSNCCNWKNDIKVRNCGDFYVYELQKTPVCSLRYCGNGGQEPTSPPPPTTPPAPDECKNYKVLSGADRAQANALQNNVRCDQRDLAPGWYRFQGAAGHRIPDKCVPMRRCGTHAPGWITGGHPTEDEGAVTRKVCYHWSNNCCLWSNNIKVRNCGDFYVYELQKTPVCSLRYCGNRGQEPTSPPPTTSPAPDECKNYNVLSGADRAQANDLQNNVRCDQRDLAPGWYRFQGAAGDRIPDKCVPMKRCGTHAPGWINGSHPAVAEGAVTRKVCYHWSNNCCRWSNNIKVRNCGAFFVYELPKTPVCSLRYCGNTGQEPTLHSPTAPPAVDGCRNYKVLSGADRAVRNALQNNVRCDQRDLAVGWYRFQGAAGDRMPDKCVPMRRCGTHAPGWITGAHPTVAEGVVTRKVCYHWSGKCCNWENNIKVRNCGAFFVYELQRTPVCSLRYCGNGGASPPTTSRPPTTPPTPFGQGFMVICLPKGMQVRIPKEVLRDTPGPLHLNDPKCVAEEESDTHVVLKSPLTGCGTVRRSLNGRHLYTNNVIVSHHSDEGNEKRQAPLSFPFMCSVRGLSLPTEGRADKPMNDDTEAETA